MSLDDFLGSPEAPSEPAPAAPEPAPAVPEPTPEPVAEKVPEPKSEPKAEPKPEPEKEQEVNGMTAKERAFYMKAKDETRKRQELEQQLAMERQRQEQEKEPPKDFWTDPDGNLNKLREEFHGAIQNTRISTAEAIARSRYSDFDEKIQVFAELVQKSPILRDEGINSPDPAEYAYKTAKNYLELQQAGDIDSLKKKIEAEVRAKVEAEFKEKESSKAKEFSNIPPTLSDARGASVNKPVWSGPPSLDDIVKKRK